MKNLLSIFGFLLFCAGCSMFSGPPPQPKAWTVSPDVGPTVQSAAEGARPAFPATRLGTVTVNAPYDRMPLVVRRPDGSVAQDPMNVFAASPASLLRAPVKSHLAADGRFGHVVGSSSVAGADATVETTVTDFSLDCTQPGVRKARVSLDLDVVKTGRGPRTVALKGAGAGEADAAKGNYSEAFSTAFSSAFQEALRSLK
ncbi:MAG: ABC-type transport auxiliary lipoprotein family protein [Kiritimatiellia bacterium]